MHHTVQIETVINAEAIRMFPELQPLLGHRVRVTVDPLEQDRLEDHYQPSSQIGRLALQARDAYIASGGPLMSAEDIAEEVRQRRGGRSDA